MKHIPVRLGAITVTLSVLAVAIFAASGCASTQQHGAARSSPRSTASPVLSDTPRPAPTLPAPSAARSSYANSVFGYSLQYPTDWKASVSDGQSRVQIYITQDPAVPQRLGFDIVCGTNSSGLSAQQWRQSEVPPNSGEQAVGYVTLSSGAQAYKVVGHATNTYDVLTLVHSSVACDLTEYETDATNTKIIEASINSFTWN